MTEHPFCNKYLIQTVLIEIQKELEDKYIVHQIIGDEFFLEEKPS